MKKDRQVQAKMLGQIFSNETPAETRRMLERNAIELGGSGGDAAVRAHINTVPDPAQRLELLQQYYPEAREIQLEGDDTPYYVIANRNWSIDGHKAGDETKPLMLLDPSNIEAGDFAEAATSVAPIAGSIAGSIAGGFVGLPGGPVGTITGMSVGGAAGAELANKLQEQAFDFVMGHDADRGSVAEQFKRSGANIVFDSTLGFVVDIPGVGMRRIGQKSLKTALRRVLKRKSDTPFQQVAFDARAGMPGTVVQGSVKEKTLAGGDIIRTGEMTNEAGEVQPFTDIIVNATLPRTWFKRSDKALKKAAKTDLANQDRVMNSTMQQAADKAKAKYGNNPDYPNARIIVQTNQTYEDIAKRGLMKMEGIGMIPEATDATAPKFKIPLTRITDSPALHALEKTVGQKGAGREIVSEAVDKFRGNIVDKMDEVLEGMASTSPASMTGGVMSGRSPAIGNRVTRDTDIMPGVNPPRVPKFGENLGATGRKKVAGNILREGLGANLDTMDRNRQFLLQAAIRDADPQKTSSSMPEFRQWMEALETSVGRAGSSAAPGKQQALTEGRKIMAMLDQKGTAGNLSLAELRTVKEGIDHILENSRVANSGSLLPGGNRELADLSTVIDREIISAIRNTGNRNAIKSLNALENAGQENSAFRLFMREFNDAGGDLEAYEFVMSDAKDAPKRLATALKSMPKEYRDAYRNSVIGTMGRTKPDGTEVGWSGKYFFDDYNAMQPEIKDLLFGKVGDGTMGEYRKNLDTLANIAKTFDEGTSYVNPTADGINASNLFTFPLIAGGLGYSVGGPLGGVAAIGIKTAGQGLTAKATADLITNPEFVKWAVGMSKMKWTYRKPPIKQISGHIARLASIGNQNPQLQNAVSEYIRELKFNLGSLAIDSASDAAGWTTDKFMEQFKSLPKETQRSMLESAAKEQREAAESTVNPPLFGYPGAF